VYLMITIRTPLSLATIWSAFLIWPVLGAKPRQGRLVRRGTVVGRQARDYTQANTLPETAPDKSPLPTKPACEGLYGRARVEDQASTPGALGSADSLSGPPRLTRARRRRQR
jgi:hypothetical protein